MNSGVRVPVLDLIGRPFLRTAIYPGVAL